MIKPVTKLIKVSTFGLVDLVPPDPELPSENASVLALRERQVRELADLDDEENRRIKAGFRRSRGLRAFRRSGAGGVSSSAGRTGQRASVSTGPRR